MQISKLSNIMFNFIVNEKYEFKYLFPKEVMNTKISLEDYKQLPDVIQNFYTKELSENRLNNFYKNILENDTYDYIINARSIRNIIE